MDDRSCWQEMMVIVCESGVVEEVVEQLRHVGVTHFTIEHGALGVGDTGRHEGNPVWPGTNAVIFTCLEQGQEARALQTLRRIHDSRPDHSLRLKVFSLPVRELL